MGKINKLHQDDGFTLVETLITLFIVSLLILLPSLSLAEVTRSIEIDLFFRELSSQIIMMQNHAILAGEATSIEFAPKNNTIDFKVNNQSGSNHPLNRQISLEDSPCQFYNGKFQTIRFRKNTGNIILLNNRWRIQFESEQGYYELVFKLGSGRFDIRKIK